MLHKLEHWEWEGTQGTRSLKELYSFSTALFAHYECRIREAGIQQRNTVSNNTIYRWRNRDLERH